MTAGIAQQEELEQPKPDWIAHLKGQIDPSWRPGEFDFGTLDLIPDPDNPLTALLRCARLDCTGVQPRGKLCSGCESEWVAVKAGSSIDFKDFLVSPKQLKPQLKPCLVPTCDRMSASQGYCSRHLYHYKATLKKKWELTAQEFAAVARVYPPADRCAVGRCINDEESQRSFGLCRLHRKVLHLRLFKSGESVSPDSVARFVSSFEPYYDAERRIAYSHVAGIRFGSLPEPMRWELLLAVQRRDVEGRTALSPLYLRRMILQLRDAGVDSLVGLAELGQPWVGSQVLAYARAYQASIDEEQRIWSGIDLRDPRVIYFSDVELRSRADFVDRGSKLDLRSVPQEWIVQTIRKWAETGPHSPDDLRSMRYAWLTASEILTVRGTPLSALGTADIDAIVREFRLSYPDPSTQTQRVSSIRNLMDFARSEPTLRDLWMNFSSTFSVSEARHRPVPNRAADKDPDDAYRFVPQPIVDWLMDRLDLLQRSTPYLTALASAMMYVHERCGRRISETASLREECISYDSTGAPYLEWVAGKPPYRSGRRLPIDQFTHDFIRSWQEIKREHGVVSKWLFPSRAWVTQDRHISTATFRGYFHDFIATVKEQAPFEGPVEGSEGNLVYFDFDTLDPYAFRHAFAQRFADAEDAEGRPTTSPETLQDYMGHSSFATTMIYITVSNKRRKRALESIPPRRISLTLGVVTIDRERDGQTKIPVTLGHCTDEENVAHGGGFCPLEGSCESCPSFLVDPMERDALVHKRKRLMVTLEKASAIRSRQHVIQHYVGKIEDISALIDGVDKFIDSLPEDEKILIRTLLEQMADLRRRAIRPRLVDLRTLVFGSRKD